MARNAFKETSLRIYQEAKRSGRLIENFDLGQAKALALTQDGIIETQLGSVAANSEPMSRAAQHTKNSVDQPFGEEEEALAAKAVQAMSSEKVLSLNVWVGDGEDGVSARFLMPLAHAERRLRPQTALRPSGHGRRRPHLHHHLLYRRGLRG